MAFRFETANERLDWFKKSVKFEEKQSGKKKEKKKPRGDIGSDLYFPRYPVGENEPGQPDWAKILLEDESLESVNKKKKKTAADHFEQWQNELFKQPGDDPNNKIHQLINELVQIDMDLRAGLQTLNESRDVDPQYRESVMKLQSREEEIVNELDRLGYFSL